MLRPIDLAACGLLLIASACNKESNGSGSHEASGASKPVSARLDDAATAMEAKEWSKALASLDAALADARATNDEKVQVWQDKVLCEAHANGEAAASAALKKMEESGVAMTANQYAKLGNDLGDANHLTAAVDVIEAATKKFGDDPLVRKNLKRLARNLQERLTAAGDQAALDRLKGLGYLSSSEDEEE